MEKRREGRLAQSQLQAKAAASGGGATDPTIIALGEGIAGQSEYASMLETFKGESRARGLEDSATLNRYEAAAKMAQASAQRTATTIGAFGSIIGGVGSAFSKYGYA